MKSKDKVYKFQTFTDSYIMFNKKVPKFLFIIVIMLVSIVVGIITWSAFIIKPDVIKASGTVTAQQKTSLNISTSSNITQVYFSEGELVNVGDTILKMDDTEVETEIQANNEDIKKRNNNIKNYGTLVEYITKDYDKDDKNHSFDPSNPDEAEFYGYMSEYQKDKEAAKTDTEKEKVKRDAIALYTSKEKQEQETLTKDQTTAIQLSNKQKLYLVTATMSGILHFDVTLSIGQLLQIGTVIGSISANDSALIVECYLTSEDRPKVKINDKVAIAVVGLSQNDYGTIEGRIIAIDSNAVMNNNSYVFKAQVWLQTTVLSSRKGTAHLSYGWQTECRIVYNQTTYLTYFLELIGIKIR